MTSQIYLWFVMHMSGFCPFIPDMYMTNKTYMWFVIYINVCRTSYTSCFLT